MTILLLFGALVFRTGLLDDTASFDEYYHFLAARGWLETGRLAILDGEYDRTGLFTVAVAEVFRLTGSATFETGRLLSVAAGVLLPAVVFLWVRAWAGWRAALLASGLTLLWPEGIEEAQRIRFYAWQVLFSTLGAFAAWQAFNSLGRYRTLWAVASIVFFVAATYLQITTVFSIAAVLLWITGMYLLPAFFRQSPSAIWVGAVLGALTAIALAVVAWKSGMLQSLWEQYRWVPGWNARHVNNIGYYHGLLRDAYPTFWPLFPMLTLLAFRRQPRLAGYCLLIFALNFVFLSFGGMKSLRYLSHAMPLFFVLCALALCEVAAIFAIPLRAGARAFDPTRRGLLGDGIILSAVLFALLANPFVDRSLGALRGTPVERFPLPDWSNLPFLMGEWIEAPYVLTTFELPTIAYLGDYDVLYSQDRITELPPFTEFVQDSRTGRPVIKEPETLRKILACHPEGVFITESRQWERPGWRDTVTSVFESSGRMIEKREREGLLVFHWGGGMADDRACAALPS